MATLREIRRRIVGVKATAKITQAMKMVAAAKLRRAQDAMIAARPYSRALNTLLHDLLSNAGDEIAKSPVLFGRKLSDPNSEKVLLVVVSSDRGLAGAFNANIIRFAESRIRETYGAHQASGRLGIITVGRRSTDYFSKRGYTIVETHVGIFNKLEFSVAQHLVTKATELFNEGDYDRVEIVYNEFKSVIAQRQVAERMLPVLDIKQLVEAQHGKASHDYIYEPEPTEILNVLVPRQLETQVWKALLESNAAEQGARMSAMDSATKNAKDLIKSLQLGYNKARQAAITKEILEIVGGAEALSQG
ncbi:MAG TPA: ATP synthase F1 subunit gamma [Candidatus Kapabacteria bacterium]|nr:ATP synthase F1 subunit gamma [Candidatus Kapabacteria bacterium]